MASTTVLMTAATASITLPVASSLTLENCLLVNKETHKIITARAINDEEELKKLCVEFGCSLKWYE